MTFLVTAVCSDLFSCRLFTTPTFRPRFSSVLSQFGNNFLKISFGRHLLDGCVTRGSPPPPPVTPLVILDGDPDISHSPKYFCLRCESKYYEASVTTESATPVEVFQTLRLENSCYLYTKQNFNASFYTHHNIFYSLVHTLLKQVFEAVPKKSLK